MRSSNGGCSTRYSHRQYGQNRLYRNNGDGKFTYDRIGRGTIHIEFCTLSILGGVQPSRIAPIVRGAMTGATNDGFVQRLQMTVWPDDLGSWTWVDRRPNALARALEHGLQSIGELGPQAASILSPEFAARLAAAQRK